MTAAEGREGREKRRRMYFQGSILKAQKNNEAIDSRGKRVGPSRLELRVRKQGISGLTGRKNRDLL